jgi:hypothetical protein
MVEQEMTRTNPRQKASNPTLKFFEHERESFMRRSTAATDEKFRLSLRSTFKNSPELVSDAVADFIAERLSRGGNHGK